MITGPQLPKKIRALASHKDYTIAAFGTEIGVFKRAQQVATWSRHEDKVNSLLLFGDHILSLDIKGNVFIWAFKGVKLNLEPVGHIQLEDIFSPSCIMHPDTYLNKVIIGSQEGPLQLWNISTRKKLYEFKGWNSSVCCCVASPALDVVAVGCSDGMIHIHNLCYDEELVSFTHSTRGAVTALSFRTDGQPLLASGGSSGIISIWNLEKRRLQSVIRDAHDGSIISLHFLANEPVLMSSAADNSIKDQQSRELSQRHVTKRAKKLRSKEEEIKLKPVIAFDFDIMLAQYIFWHYAFSRAREVAMHFVLRGIMNFKIIFCKMAQVLFSDLFVNKSILAEIRERDWCNVVTCHMDTPRAYVWRLQNFVLGEHILTPSADNQTPVKACAISACGNFAILGTEGGWIERFNLQSGISRGSYVDISEARQCAHDGEVVGVACDAANSIMISVGYQGDIKVWDFKGCELTSRWEVGCGVTKIVYHRTNGLLATVADDMVLRLFDVVALRLVRKFEGHSDRITDLCFSEDGKWLLSSSMDGSLRIWDVIFARQIDAIHVDVPITAVSLSPSMDIMATSHVDQNGIYLWANQAMFSGSSHIDLYGSGKEVRKVQMPSASLKEGSEEGEPIHASGDPYQIEKARPVPYPNLQIPNLITLSLLPRSQWQSLTNLDIIKVWDFKGCELTSRWEVGCGVTKIVYHRTNGLLATVADDMVLRLFDVVALRLVRKFEGHSDRITDLCFSEDGKWLLSSSMDGSLRIWDVIFARQIDAIHVDVPITAVSLSPSMDIMATSHVDQNGLIRQCSLDPPILISTVADDMVLRLFDVVALRLVRKFEGHSDRITDLCFSEDGKWLLSSSMDGSLRIWDVIFARQIDAIHVDVPITAVSLSPSMDIMATSHVDQNGIYLWANQAMFSGSSHIDLYGSGKEVRKVQMPSASLKEGSEEGASGKV
ncbi:hypothetical protein COCNU_01G018740 [Cocos nucifera]|uniref:WDR36/Utp21 N-terminal domain-containing protein n=1 Tax=Cocos nucifera TaxID=13894 RepID=A0A8K0MVY9_COCNU|nr:hypothetical protein COCNU_01G018740 [Cocos nucifera]